MNIYKYRSGVADDNDETSSRQKRVKTPQKTSGNFEFRKHHQQRIPETQKPGLLFIYVFLKFYS